MNPIISIIIPVYNVEKYLCKCIDSVLGQTYKELEIILVDDGSTDNSGVICDEYEKKDDRIKVIHKKNGGLSDARNCGLDNAIGEYIAFLDSDDWVDFKYIEILYENLRNYNADISICNFRRVHDEKELLNNHNNIILYNNIEALQQIYTNKSVQAIVAWNKLYKKSIFKKNRFPKGKIHEDEYLIPILLYSTKRVVYTDKELVYYRQTPNSIMNSKFKLKNLDYLYALRERNKFFKENNLSELYQKGINSEVEKIIESYFYVQESDIKNKKEVMQQIYKYFIYIEKSINIKLESNIKRKAKLFKCSPLIYRILLPIFLKLNL